MSKTLYFHGTPKEISWIFQSEEKTVKQKRVHADIYLDKVTDEQSRFIAFHVGLFWCIGTFLIVNHDEIDVMIDSKSMYDYLMQQFNIEDIFIEKRTGFINQLIEQRDLKINYQLIDNKDNKAAKIIK